MSEIITLDTANNEIRMYLKNFSNATSAINTIADQPSKEYYDGKEISYIFERNVIEALWKLNPNADGLRVYYGSYSEDTEKNGILYKKGTPTLVLIACKITKDVEKNNIIGCENLIYDSQIAGGEWPDGRGKGIVNLTKSDVDFNVRDDNF